MIEQLPGRSDAEYRTSIQSSGIDPNVSIEFRSSKSVTSRKLAHWLAYSLMRTDKLNKDLTV